MRAYIIVIFHVRQQHVTKMPFSQDDDMIEAFPADQADQPFNKSVLPRGAQRRWSITNVHRLKPADEGLTIGSIPIPDQIAGSLFPAASFSDLICDPFCDWMRCDAKPYNPSSTIRHNHQAIEQTKRDRRHDEQIHRGNAVGMIMKERLPSLRWRASSHGHILGYARLSDIDIELEKFVMDPRCAPQRIRNAHFAN